MKKALRRRRTRLERPDGMLPQGVSLGGPRYPLGALVYYRAKGDLGEPNNQNWDCLQDGIWRLGSDSVETFS